MCDDAQLEHVTREWLENSTTAASSSSAAGPSPTDFAQPDTMWMISLVASNAPLIQTAARLFMHLRSQYERKKKSVADRIDQLRDVHEKELAIMLGMADGSGRNVVVNSQTTQRVFERHSAELANAVADGDHQLQLTLRELRSNLLSFFFVAAPDIVGAPESSSSEAAFCRSAFSQLRCPIWFGKPTSNIVTIRIVNPLRGKFVGARPKDPSLSAIVMDIAPLSLLAQCLPLGRSGDDNNGGISSSSSNESADETAERVQISFKRLATNRNHALWIVADERELRQLLNEADEPELLLDERLGWQEVGEVGRAGHSTAPADGVLRMKSSTSVWGGNFIFHWNPQGSTAGREGRLARHVLHHALAWNVDGLSIAFGQASAPEATIARLFTAVHEEVANCQMDSNCTRPQHAWALHYSSVRQSLPDFNATVGPVPSASGKATFNLPFGITMFVGDSHDVSSLVQRIFDGDAEVVA